MNASQNRNAIPFDKGEPEGQFPQIRAIKVRLSDFVKRRDVETTVNQIHACGFNLAILDVFYDGQTIFQSTTCEARKLTKQRHSFKSFDPLDTFLTVALGKGITAFASLDGFLLGQTSKKKSNPLLRKRSAWVARTINGKPTHPGGEASLIYICPSNPDARRFIGDLACEITERYPVNGIFFDHIQYPINSNTPSRAYCFCDVCKELVDEELGIDLENIVLEEDDRGYIQWTSWREAQLHDSLIYFRTRLGRNRPSLPVAVAVNSGEDPRLAVRTDLVDWQTWATDGVADLLVVKPFPVESVMSCTQFEKEIKGIPQDCTVLPAYDFDDAKEFEKELKVYRVNRVAVAGFLFYAESPFLENVVEFFQKSVFDDKAYLSLAYPLHAIANLLKHACDEVNDNDEVEDFLKEMVALFENDLQAIAAKALPSVLENINGLARITNEGEVDGLYDEGNFARCVCLAGKVLKLLIRRLRT